MHPPSCSKSQEMMLAQTVALSDQSLDAVALIGTAEVLLSCYGKDGAGRSFPLDQGRRVDNDSHRVGNEGVPRSKKGVYISLEMQTLFLRERIA